MEIAQCSKLLNARGANRRTHLRGLTVDEFLQIFAALAETLDSRWVQDRFKDIVANVAPREERSPAYAVSPSRAAAMARGT